MYDQKVSLREHLRLFIRTFRLVNHLAPGITVIQLFRALCQAFMPFIAILMSARILDEMVGARDPVRLALYAVAAVMSAFVTAILRGVFSRIYSRMNVKVTANQEIFLANKAYAISHEMAEDKEITLLRKTIDSNAESGVGGLFEALWFTNNFFRYACAVGIAVGVTREMFLTAGGAAPIALALLAAASIAVICANWLNVNKTIRHLYGSIGESKMLYDFYMTGYIDDNRAAKDIRMFGTEKFISDELRRRVYRPQYTVRKSSVVKEGNHSVLTTALMALLGGAVYVYTAVQARSGSIAVGNVIQYYGGITQLISAVSSMIVAFFALIDNNYCIKPLFAYLDLPEAEQPGSAPIREFQNSIVFRNVTFRYAPGLPPALTNCNLEIKRGEHIAAVGRNGSGKSTFVKLLCRLYKPQNGQIMMDGTDIRQYAYDDFQHQMAVVFQDYKLFAFSVGSNVAGGSRYNSDRVWQALELAGIRKRIEQLPDQLHTALYQDYETDGIEPSGGEKQKLAISRALFKQAPILILDEPTAALDPLSEAEIYENFSRITEDKTVIYISHRLSSCKFCDRIIVFDGGEIVQSGSHDELLNDTDGLYAQLWYAQAKYYQK